MKHLGTINVHIRLDRRRARRITQAGRRLIRSWPDSQPPLDIDMVARATGDLIEEQCITVEAKPRA
jgi:hypothetical protein